MSDVIETIDEKETYKALKIENSIFKYKTLYSFCLSIKEVKTIRDWQEEHKNIYHADGSKEQWSYEFTETPFGTKGKIKCSCGKEFKFREV